MKAPAATDERIADMVREEWDQRPNEIVGQGAYRINRRVDQSIRAVASKLDMDWRPVLRAYRAKYPLKRPLYNATLASPSKGPNIR